MSGQVAPQLDFTLKILILKPSSLGDVVQALPVLRLLKLHFPQSEIHWWIDSTFRSLLEADPDLSGIVLFERRRWSSPRHWDELLASVDTARRDYARHARAARQLAEEYFESDKVLTRLLGALGATS